MSRRQTKDTTKTVTVKQATFDLLRAFGIKKVFGNPGSTELPFLADWPDDIDYVLGLQEASVVGMADGYAQATRNAGFVNLHSAAGLGNALGNIFTSYRNQTPLVIIAGQQARSILPLEPFLYSERASEFPRPYVKYSVEPARPEDVPAAIARAYYTAMQPPCGPTFVSVPSDDWMHPAQPLAARQREPRDRSRCRGHEGAGGRAVGQQASGLRGRPCRRSRRGRRSDGEGCGESKSRGLGQSVLGALLLSGTASAIRGLPARLAVAIVGRFARPRSGGRGRRAGLYFPCRRPCRDLRRWSHDLPDHRRRQCRRLHARRHQHHRHHEAGAVGAAGGVAREQARGSRGPQARAGAGRSRSDPGRIPHARAVTGDVRRHGAGRGSALAPAGDAEFHADARPGQFLHHGERRARLWPAGRGRRGAWTRQGPHRLPDRRRLGDVFDPGAVDGGAAEACRSPSWS